MKESGGISLALVRCGEWISALHSGPKKALNTIDHAHTRRKAAHPARTKSGACTTALYRTLQ